ncbi:MAG: hypothetical protein H0V82_00255 [Candidatus Protochlamydia sp.]|nr:hypothetical protein [Candidatus Protochlamydia sp.]
MKPLSSNPFPFNTDVKLPQSDLTKITLEDSQHEGLYAVQDNSEKTKTDQVSQLANWFKNRALLLANADTSSPADENLVQKEAMLAKAEAFTRTGALRKGVEGAVAFSGTVGLGLNTSSQLGLKINPDALADYGYVNMVGKELVAGLSFMGAKWQLHNMQAEREEIVQTINQFPLNHEARGLLTTQKMQLDKQIAKQEEIANGTILSILGAHLENTVLSIIKILGFLPEPAALTATFSLGAIFSTAGMVASGVGVASQAIEHYGINSRLVNMERISAKHDNPKIAAALDTVKTSAIDQMAHHQKRNIEIGIFQNAFTLCQTAFTVGVTLTGAILGAASIATVGIGLPIAAGVGLLIAGGVAIYQHRHTIGRALQGLVNWDTSERSPLSMERNLAYRQWSRQAELKGAVKKLEVLAKKWQASNAADTALVQKLDQKMKFKATRVIALTNELEEIRYEKASQILKDQTRSLSSAQKSRQEVIDDSLNTVNKEMNEVNAVLDKLKNSPLQAYKEVKAAKLEAAEKSMAELNEYLNILQTSDNKIKLQFTRLVEKELEAKEDEFNLVNGDSPYLLEQIQLLKSYLANIDTKITAEVERLTQIKTRIEERTVQVSSPTPEMIQAVVKEYESKLAQLKAEQNDLQIRKNEELQPREVSSAQALVEALNEMTETELIQEFIPQCRKSFPGVHFDEIETKQNKAMYIKMQIQKAITSDTLL